VLESPPSASTASRVQKSQQQLSELIATDLPSRSAKLSMPLSGATSVEYQVPSGPSWSAMPPETKTTGMP
jgi:hypothetical protein